MTTRLFLVFAVFGVVLAVAGRFALAQVDFERRPTLAPNEQTTQGANILARVEAIRGQIAKELQGAREARDVVRALCLNDKLSQIDVLRRAGADRMAQLQAAIARADRELADHEFTILTVQRTRAEQIASEAMQCIGSEMAFVGQTQVETTIDPNLPPVDVTGTVPEPPLPPGIMLPPVSVTPTSGP